MTELASRERTRTADHALRERARRVIPNSMYGHLSAVNLPASYPQFYDRGRGARVWDVDGNEYVDLMCSFGPSILGYAHPAVEQAAAAQRARGDTLSGPAGCMVELAELLTDRVAHADWAMFAKNGTDATSLCLAVARATTGRSAVLAARGAYHGWSSWCNLKPAGMPPEERASVFGYTFNDLASVQRALDEAGAVNVAAVFVSPFRHDAGHDQELVDPAFARGLRELCDTHGAALIIDEVRAGFRLTHGGSWEPLGVQPDLSAWSKAIGNGYPIAAALGSGRFRGGAEEIFATGSFWYQAVPMAAAIATIRALRDEDAIASMEKAGQQLRDGISRQAAEHQVAVRQTGPVQMPNLSFPGDAGYTRASLFCGTAAAHGTLLHPRHNWFLSAAHTSDDIDQALQATDEAFRAVRAQFGSDESKDGTS
ncbi:MAG: aminotransferase class III-fold pyridoxal phosphate-dependent enzyme [Actinomycetota bacterium]